MRVVLDFQACQSASRYRGIGRASRALMLAMANSLTSRGHEVVCLASGAFSEGLDVLLADIKQNAPGGRVVLFQIASNCAAAYPDNAWRQMAARMLREHAIACLEPDFVHVPALLADGWGDDAVGSIGMLGTHVPTSLTQHDLIPLVMADIYMPPGTFRDYYMQKLEGVRQADLFLAISQHSRQEAIEWLGVAEEDVVHISSAVDPFFLGSAPRPEAVTATLEKFGISPGFLLYAPGGFDARKNIDKLLEAYSLLPVEVRVRHQLVLASKLHDGMREEILQKSEIFGLAPSEITLTDYVHDEQLKHLYHACYFYVFPSLHEGFGLPALEAMCCGAPVIASNCTSIPEVIEMDEALFDPNSARSMAEKMQHVINDEKFRERLIAHAAIQPKKFSWKISSEIAVDAIEKKHKALKDAGWRVARRVDLPSCDDLLARLHALVPAVTPHEVDLENFRLCYEINFKSCRA